MTPTRIPFLSFPKKNFYEFSGGKVHVTFIPSEVTFYLIKKRKPKSETLGKVLGGVEEDLTLLCH